ncbi:5,6-dimethylbenzimidazole synthase [Mesoterricola sediminis]|uniref:Oxidoreductase n=1 Tax=Mesoterricola sediminis TaxID=2927980 RepID=A0AA48GS01_9BACT|nr:5,6-dimethylbenzimidazole synthase [Mesoterricola sediminis]BDU75089.1 oxidoreductase [Mesoterricola sediminis]
MPAFPSEFQVQLRELFRLRRDVRRFRTDPVPDELVLELLGAAHLAPSVGLSQPWRFILVEDPGRRQAVIDEFQRANDAASSIYDSERARLYRSLKLAGLREAPVHLLVCVETDPDAGHGLGRQTQPATLRDSAVCAIQNLWLTARAKGVGVGWVSILEPERLREVMGLPPTWDWVGYLCIGWPQEEPEVPVLQTAGWDHRHPLEAHLLRR